MSAKVRVLLTPLYGVLGQPALCYLLQVDDTRILLDCGWNDRFQLDMLTPLKAVASSIDIVLLSHCDLEHLGALPYLFGKLGCKASVYSTNPVNLMGQMFMYEAVQAAMEIDPSFDAVSLDDVDAAFKRAVFGGPCTLLRYGEEVTLKGVTFAASPAGHSIGGSVWQLTKGAEAVVYAVDYNDRKERHLPGAALATLFRGPSALIADAHSLPLPLPATAHAHTPRKADVDRELAAAVRATLLAGGSVFMPTDAAGRALELLMRLEGVWRDDPELGRFHVVFLSHNASKTIEFAQNMLEFMRPELAAAFASKRELPFDYLPNTGSRGGQQQQQQYTGRAANAHAPARVVIAHSLASLDAQTADRYGNLSPAVVLAPLPSLAAGFARDLFQRYRNQPRSLILFTDRSGIHAGCTAEQLLQLALASPGAVWAPPVPTDINAYGGAYGGSHTPQLPQPAQVTIDAITHVPLEGVELRRWREAQDAARLAAQRAADAARVAAEEAAELVPESMDMHERPPAAPNVVVSVHAAGAASPAAAGKPASAASATTATTSSDQQQQQQQSSSSLLGKRSRPDSVQSQSDVKGASPAAPSSATTTTSTTTADPAEEPDPTAAAASDLEFDFVFEYTDDEAEAGDDGSTARGPLLVDDMAAFRPPRAIAAAAYALANDAEALVKSGGKPTLLALSTGTTTAPSPSAAAPASLASAAARAGGLAARFPMFQRDDSALRAPWTDYGQTIDPAAYADTSSSNNNTTTAIAPATAAQAPSTSAGPISASASSQPPTETVPTKTIRTPQPVDVHCRIQYIDIEGRAEPASVRNIFEAVAPKALVLVHGTREATEALASSCAATLQSSRWGRTRVSAPAVGEAVDISSDTAQFVVPLHESVYPNLQISKIHGYEVAYMDAELAVDKRSKGGTTGILTVASGPPPGHKPVLLHHGQLRIPNARTALAQAGIETDVVEGGALVTRRSGIIVSRAPGAVPGYGLAIEGPPCPEYFAVRDVIYRQYTVV